MPTIFIALLAKLIGIKFGARLKLSPVGAAREVSLDLCQSKFGKKRRFWCDYPTDCINYVEPNGHGRMRAMRMAALSVAHSIGRVLDDPAQCADVALVHVFVAISR
jgi:hypothetical protein